MKNTKRVLFILGSLCIFWGLLEIKELSIAPPTYFTVFRWVLWLVFCYYAFLKKSLTTWILVSMLIGAELGHSFPDIAVHFQVLSKAFLKLIKVIIAPLLFGTLVVG